MTTPIEIDFHGIDRSEATEALVQQKVAKLERNFDRMTYCRVVIAAPHRHAHKRRAYQVKIEIGIPGHAPVIVLPDDAYNQAHEDIKTALRDAFQAAGRQLDAQAERLGRAARQERGRRRPSPSSA